MPDLMPRGLRGAPTAALGSSLGSWLGLLLGGALAACDQTLYWVCDEVPRDRLHALPQTLSESGLFAKGSPDVLSEGVEPYAPRFALWSDGATKRRWVQLPVGARIDSRDPDAWVFPEGTQFWKEFTRDGVRVETRLLRKVGPGEDDWVGMAYFWSEDQREANAVPYGAIDAQGTPHDVPAASECMACHGGTKSRVLGFSAVQLGVESSVPGWTLRTLAESGLLTDTPRDTELEIPGTAVEQAALGYLHANCSHCHNQARPTQAGARCFDPNNGLDFRLSGSALETPEDTNTYRTIDEFVVPGSPGKSPLFDLVSHRGFFQQMPPLATESVDAEAVATLRAWIEAM